MLKYRTVVLAFLIIVLSDRPQSMASSSRWGNDVLVHQAEHVYGFGMDQADKDTLLLVTSDSSTTNLRDTLYIYRSTSNGQIWSRTDSLFSAVDGERFGKADIIVAKGYGTYEDSDFVFIFFINNTQLCCARYPYDFSSTAVVDTISGAGENVVDFAVCELLRSDYYLLAAYQTDQDSVIFKRSTDFGNTWTQRKNLFPITSQPSVAWSRYLYLVAVGKTKDDMICTIRNDSYGNSASWNDLQYPSPPSNTCGYPTVVASHTTPSIKAVFWIFYQCWDDTANPPRWILNCNYSANSCSSWSPTLYLNDTSNGDASRPSLHVLKELDASNITSVYRYEDGNIYQIRCIYEENGQDTLASWPVSYTGSNDVSCRPLSTPPPKGFTIRKTDNLINSAVLYVDSFTNGLYFDASSFSGVGDKASDKPMKRFSSSQNYLNPFNARTTIEYSLDKDGQINIIVHNILGNKIKTLLSGHKCRGNYKVVWDGTDDDGNSVASGIYFCSIRTEDEKKCNKMLLVK